VGSGPTLEYDPGVGRCLEFGSVIDGSCRQPMSAGPGSCSCTACGSVCRGRFEGCPGVWARGGSPLALLAVGGPPSDDGHRSPHPTPVVLATTESHLDPGWKAVPAPQREGLLHQAVAAPPSGGDDVGDALARSVRDAVEAAVAARMDGVAQALDAAHAEAVDDLRFELQDARVVLERDIAAVRQLLDQILAVAAAAATAAATAVAGDGKDSDEAGPGLPRAAEGGFGARGARRVPLGPPVAGPFADRLR